MRLDVHTARYLESLEAIEGAVEKGIATRQRTIGFHVSAASIDLLSYYLFREKLISLGTNLQHNWFRSAKRIGEMLTVEFPNKERILELMLRIESVRDPFCYGKTRTIAEIREALAHFQELRAIFRSMGVAPDAT